MTDRDGLVFTLTIGLIALILAAAGVI